jgi:hypothetical protein
MDEWHHGRRGEECCTVLRRLLVALVHITEQEVKDPRGEECLHTLLSLYNRKDYRVLAISVYNKR